MTVLATLDPVLSHAVAPSAVAWIDGHQARVAMVGLDGEVMTCEVSRGWLSEPTYLRQVVRVIGTASGW